MFKIIFKQKNIIVYINNDIFLIQNYIKSRQFTLFYVFHLLNKYGMTFEDQ